MTYNTRFSWRNPLAWLLGFVLLGLAACAQVGDEETGPTRKLVYPGPPDEPRFYFERTIRGSADVETVQEDSKLKQLLTGEGAVSFGMRKPYAVAVHRGRIFVSDTFSRVVKVYDVAEGRHFTIGDSEKLSDKERLVKPIGISVDEAGTLFVADATQKLIMVYDRDGNFLRKFGGADLFSRLTSVSVDKKGERVYVVDIGGAQSKGEFHRVLVFNGKTGENLFNFGARGSGPGEFNLPRAVAIGKDKLFVVDGGNFRIQVFGLDGKFLKSFGEVGKQIGNFARPKEAATDNDGNVYVIDAAYGNFQIFNPEGQLLMFIGERSEEPGPGRFNLPSGITVDEDGRIYVVDQMFKKVDIFRPAKLGENEGFLVKKEPQKK
ncbi:MAG: 6-bladed beta-propeller [Nitrosomonadales bacterium]|nr:6-bladed beta-propeller [Nitrosomonadales bacterium]